MYRGMDIGDLAAAVEASSSVVSPAASPQKPTKVVFVEELKLPSEAGSDGQQQPGATAGTTLSGFTKLVDRRNSASRRRSSTSSIHEFDSIGGSSSTINVQPVHIGNAPVPTGSSNNGGGSGAASSLWRLFGSQQRPAPEWRRKPSQTVSKFLEHSRRLSHDVDANPPSPQASSRTGAGMEAFELGQSYRESRADASHRKSVASLGASTRRRPSSASSQRPPKVTTVIGVTEDEVAKRLARAIATTELECIEKYERALIESAEREATFVVAARHALVERDAARSLLASKNKRIRELEALVESLAQRFLFFGGASSNANLLNRGNGTLESGSDDARPQPVPVLVDGELPYESTGLSVVPRSTRSAEDSKLVMKLRDAIAAFERKQASAAV